MSHGRKICLFGDKQMEKLSNVMSDAGIDHFGGMVINSHDLVAGNFHLTDEHVFSVETDSKDYLNWKEIANLIEAEEVKPLVVTNFAVQSVENIDNLISSISKFKDIDSASIFDYVDYLKHNQKKQLAVIKRISELGCNVTVLSDPPFFENSNELTSKYIYKYFNALEYLLGEYNVSFLNVAILFNNEIGEQDPYILKNCDENINDKAIYGNDKYYKWVAAKIMNDNLNKSYWINI